MPDDRTAEALRFLSILFDGKADTDYIVIWCRHRKADRNYTFCYRGLEEAAERAVAEAAKGADVYFGVGPLYLDLTGQPRRGKKPEVLGLSCFWLDLDIINEKHKKANLFINQQAARDFLTEIDLLPTIINDSGGGLQCFFLVERLRRFTGQEDREYIDRLSQGFQQKVRREALARVNCEVDMTGDITRVLRLPGTFNQWYEPAPRISILEYHPESIFTFEQFERFATLAPATLLDKPKLAEPIPDLTSIHATLPDSCRLLMDLEPRFKAAMYREGGTLSGKTSDSEYDLSICSQALHAGVSDAEIVAAGAWSRRNFAKSEDARDRKWRRQDYWERTLRRAHSSNILPVSEVFAEKDAEIVEQPSEPRELDYDYLYLQMSRALGVTVLGIWEFGGEPPVWQIETDRGRVILGNPAQMMSWQRFSAAIYALHHHHIKRFKAEPWLDLLNLVGKVVRGVEIGELASDAYWLANRIVLYVWSGRVVEYETDPGVWITQSTPKYLKFNGDRWIRLDDFCSWLFHEGGIETQPPRQTWGRLCTAIGMVTVQIPMKREGAEGSVKQWFWRIAKEMLE